MTPMEAARQVQLAVEYARHTRGHFEGVISASGEIEEAELETQRASEQFVGVLASDTAERLIAAGAVP